MLAAYSDTVTVSSKEIWPDSIASKMRISVMIFVILAGRRTVWEFFSYRIVPVDASMRRTLGADRLRTSDESAAGVDSAGVSERTNVLSKEKMFFGRILS